MGIDDTEALIKAQSIYKQRQAHAGSPANL
jgi:hypothetical protein